MNIICASEKQNVLLLEEIIYSCNILQRIDGQMEKSDKGT